MFEKTFGGLSRQYYFRGPFAGLRVSTRAVLITSGIENLAQLRAAIAAGTVVLDDDTSGDGLTHERWAELRRWLGAQRA